MVAAAGSGMTSTQLQDYSTYTHTLCIITTPLLHSTIKVSKMGWVCYTSVCTVCAYSGILTLTRTLFQLKSLESMWPGDHGDIWHVRVTVPWFFDWTLKFERKKNSCVQVIHPPALQRAVSWTKQLSQLMHPSFWVKVCSLSLTNSESRLLSVSYHLQPLWGFSSISF